MADSIVKLETLLNKIDEHKLVLPDFQRDYVWIKEDDKIGDFIASVLAQLPIGSIITFKDNYNSFSNKEIGFNKVVKFSEDAGKVEFLLDGQQRVTTLSLVFSDRIFRKIKTDNENYKADSLVQKYKIKKRYFLKIPKYDSSVFEDDFFGFENLNFPFKSTDNIPFCSNDIRDLIVFEQFNFTSDLWYSPSKEDYKDRNFKKKVKNGSCESGLIPLYFLSDHSDLIDIILDEMADRRAKEISELYDIENVDDLRNYISLNDDVYSIDLSKDDRTVFSEFKEVLSENKKNWVTNMYNYLTNCIKQLRINTIDVDDENTARAINMYEALNKGGAKLTTYDLIIARAASKGKYGEKSYDQNNRDIISDYCNDKLFNLVKPSSSISSWNSKDRLKTITSNGEIVPIVINQFLNLLCFVSDKAQDDFKIPNVIFSKLPNDYCKAKRQLQLSSDNIVKYSEKCMKSIMDALMILQFKCGIFDISQLDYNLLLLPLSYIMYLFESKTVDESRLTELVNKVCGLYYYCMFAGEYMVDQSTVVMKHLEWAHNWIVCGDIPAPFKEEKYENSILNINKYNDFKTLIYEEDQSPKKAVRNSILQYILSTEPCDFITGTEYKNLNSWSGIAFEIHHMIPLASATSIKESSTKLRDENIPLNSPLNMALISKEANRTISNYQIPEYKDHLESTFLANYKMSSEVKSFTYSKSDENDKKLEALLKARYDNIRSEIILKIRKYIA